MQVQARELSVQVSVRVAGMQVPSQRWPPVDGSPQVAHWLLMQLQPETRSYDTAVR